MIIWSNYSEEILDAIQIKWIKEFLPVFDESILLIKIISQLWNSL